MKPTRIKVTEKMVTSLRDMNNLDDLYVTEEMEEIFDLSTLTVLSYDTNTEEIVFKEIESETPAGWWYCTSFFKEVMRQLKSNESKFRMEF